MSDQGETNAGEMKTILEEERTFSEDGLQEDEGFRYMREEALRRATCSEDCPTCEVLQQRFFDQTEQDHKLLERIVAGSLELIRNNGQMTERYDHEHQRVQRITDIVRELAALIRHILGEIKTKDCPDENKVHAWEVMIDQIVKTVGDRF